jgi:agmatinase
MTVKILGIPQDNNSSFMEGPSLAPMQIIEALTSDSSNMFSETGLELISGHIWKDVGCLDLKKSSGQKAFDIIRKKVKEQIVESDYLISLGGDHSISWPVIDAHADRYSPMNILHIDAHPDLYENMLDNKYSHASPFARLMESGRYKRLVQVGIRTLTTHQREQADRFNIEIHEMSDLSKINQIEFEGPVYCSVDLDVLDPAYAPGVSHFEPGGMSTRYLLDFLENFKGQLVGADIVELNPRRDFHNLTAMVAAKILKELIARIFRSNYG